KCERRRSRRRWWPDERVGDELRCHERAGGGSMGRTCSRSCGRVSASSTECSKPTTVAGRELRDHGATTRPGTRGACLTKRSLTSTGGEGELRGDTGGRA